MRLVKIVLFSFVLFFSSVLHSNTAEAKNEGDIVLTYVSIISVINLSTTYVNTKNWLKGQRSSGFWLITGGEWEPSPREFLALRP